MRCPRCKHRPLSFRETLLYVNPFRCGQCGAVLMQSRLALGAVVPAVIVASRALFDGVVTGGLGGFAVGVGMGIAAWLTESAVTYAVSPHRLCDPGFQPQVPDARLIEAARE
jgi:ribosomal protein S27E